MTIPDFQTLMRPVLAQLADGEPRRSRDVIGAMADEFSLTQEERESLLPSGRQRRFDNRVGWAITYLSQAGLVTHPARGHVRITDEGAVALGTYRDRIDMGVLDAYPGYREFRERTRENKGASIVEEPEVEHTQPGLSPQRLSPQDLVERAVAENDAAIEGELLQKALDLEPRGFELLVIRLLEAMGYGRSGMVEHSGRSGDAGIDGIISQDPLGLDRIYIQAKRYAADQTIMRPTIQGFVGALMGAQGDRGVFITTSSFSSGAQQEAERVNARIELIDGRRLAKLMVRYGVGVQADTQVTLYQLDEDFFETL